MEKFECIVDPDGDLRYYVARQTGSRRHWLMKEEYFLCDRFFPDGAFQAYCGGAFREIVSVDTLLFPERRYLSREEAVSVSVPDGKQVIAVRLIEPGETPDFAPQGFEFCGFDLAEELSEVSSLVNCGGFPSAFTSKDQNAYGLISEYEKAEVIRNKIAEKYPDDSHSECGIYCVFRRLNG